MAESSLTHLRKNLALQQDARAEADAKWRFSSTQLEKTKADFEDYKQSVKVEQAALVKRVEDAEGRLKPVTEELSSLKRHVARMTKVVFGKCC